MQRLRSFTTFLLATAVAFSSALAQTTPVDRLAASYHFPVGSYAPASRIAALETPLPPGSLQLNEPGIPDANLMAHGFETLPAEYGLRCQDRAFYVAPAVPEDFWTLRRTLLDLPDAAGLGESNGQVIFRRNQVFGWMTWQGSALFLGTCTVAPVAGPARTFSPVIGLFQGQPVAVMAGLDGTLAWCGPGGPERTLRLTRGGLRVMALSWDGARLAVAGWDPGPVILLLNARTGEVLRRVGWSFGLDALAFSGDGQTLLVHDVNSTYALLDARTGEVLGDWSNESWRQGGLLGGGASSFVQVGAGSGPLRVLDGLTGRMTRNLNSYEVTANALTPDGLWAVTADRRGQLKAYRSRDTNLGFPRAPDSAVTLGTASAATLLIPGRSPDEVLALVPSRTSAGAAAVQLLGWRVNERSVAALNTVEIRPRDLLALDLGAGTLTAVPACLPEPLRP
ncbi:hypothetical protein [Deinococcus depolymerans]|uniref:WD40 repeat domain-containing protein n=1 Tax=Deinococcus depolymerans TaxID=392408 RepID=A0ABP3M4T6_9DEIO